MKFFNLKIVLSILIFSGCQHAALPARFTTKKKYITKCVPTKEFSKIQQSYFDSFDQSGIIEIEPYIISKKDKCVGLFACAFWEKSGKNLRQTTIDRPLLIFENKIYTNQKSKNKAEEIYADFRGKYSSHFSELDLRTIERHFLRGKIEFFLH